MSDSHIEEKKEIGERIVTFVDRVFREMLFYMKAFQSLALGVALIWMYYLLPSTHQLMQTGIAPDKRLAILRWICLIGAVSSFFTGATTKRDR